MFKRIIIVTILLSICCLNLFSLNPDIYIANIGPGDSIPFRWGHFTVVVDYKDSNKRDLVYDYGNFSPNQENFYTDFIKGIMNYYKFRKPADIDIQRYIYENRDVEFYLLDLDRESKLKYLDKLATDVTKGNNIYQYDQFKNNCVSEVIKDLNNLTNGYLLKDLDKTIDRSYRDMVREYIHSHIPYYYLLNFVMGSKVDSKITKKDTLFLPDYASWLIEERLSTDKRTIYKSSGRDPVVRGATPRYLTSIIIGALLSLLTLLISYYKKSDAIVEIILGLLLSAFGAVLFFMSFFTGHYYIHNNFNLVFMNPLSIIYLVSGILKLMGKKTKISLYFTLITVGAIAIMAILKPLGVISQQNLDIILLITPSYLVKLLREKKGIIGYSSHFSLEDITVIDASSQ